MHLSMIQNRDFCRSVAKAEQFEFVESKVRGNVHRLPYGCVYFTESRRVIFNENVTDRATEASNTVVRICKHNFPYGKYFFLSNT